MRINIAIDGPSAAGKSSVADKLAKKLGYVHLDTGAMYRMVAYLCLKNGIATEDEDGAVEALKRADIRIKTSGDIYLDGNKISDELRSETISMKASDVSKNPKVREALVAMQQRIAKDKGYILDGRDIGTVVLKDAEVKIFLVADPKERAKRRILQNEIKGIECDHDKILEDINKRDYQDTHREVSPLKKADDALLIDTSDLTLDEVVDKIYGIVLEKIK